MRIGIMVGPETRRYAAKVDQMVDDAKAADDCRLRDRRGSRSSRRTSTP